MRRATRRQRSTYNLFHPFLGMDTTGFDFLSNDTAVYDMTNLVFVDSTDLSPEGIGYVEEVAPYNTARLFRGYGAYDSTHYIISNNKGYVKLDTTTSQYDILEQGSTDTILSHAKFNNDLVMATSGRIMLYDGSTLTENPIMTNAGLSSTSCRAVSVYNNRMLYAGLNDNLDALLVSDLNNPTTADLTGDNANDGFLIEIDPQNSGGLVGINVVRERGTNTEYVVLFKRNAVYLMKGSTETTVSVTKIYEGYGTYNNNTHAQVGSDVYFINEQGLFSLNSTIETGNMQVESIDTVFVNKYFDKVKESYDEVELILSPTEREIWVSIPEQGKVKGMLVYAFDRKIIINSTPTNVPYWTYLAPYKFKGLHSFNNATFGFDSKGTLHRLRTGNLFNGEVPEWSLNFKDLTFQAPERYKSIDFGNLMLKVARYPNVTVNWQWRGGFGTQSYMEEFLRLDPAEKLLRRLTRPETEEGRNALLASYNLPITEPSPAVGKYFYGWAKWGEARYASHEYPRIDLEYGNSHYGSDSYTSFKNNVVSFGLAGFGAGRVFSINLNGEGSEKRPVRIVGLTLRIQYGQVVHHT